MARRSLIILIAMAAVLGIGFAIYNATAFRPSVAGGDKRCPYGYHASSAHFTLCQPAVPGQQPYPAPTRLGDKRCPYGYALPAPYLTPGVDYCINPSGPDSPAPTR